jgi:hypothetical protein
LFGQPSPEQVLLSCVVIAVAVYVLFQKYSRPTDLLIEYFAASGATECLFFQIRTMRVALRRPSVAVSFRLQFQFRFRFV